MHDPLTTDDDGLALLAMAVDEIERGAPLSGQVRTWLAAGLRAGIEADCSFEDGLGLAGRGRRPLRVRLARARGESFLAKAIRAAPVTTYPASDWRRCLCLAPLLKRYSLGTLRGDLRAQRCSSVEPWRVYAFHAAEQMGDLPATPESLWAVLKRHRTNSARPGWSKVASYFATPPCQASTSNSSGPSDPA